MKSETRQTEEDIRQLKDRFVEYFREVPVQKYAAMYIGRTEQTIINWLRGDEGFFNRVEEARADWVKKQASKVKAEFALERLEKEIWAERKEVEIKGDPRIEILNKYMKEEKGAGETKET